MLCYQSVGTFNVNPSPLMENIRVRTAASVLLAACFLIGAGGPACHSVASEPLAGRAGTPALPDPDLRPGLPEHDSTPSDPPPPSASSPGSSAALGAGPDRRSGPQDHDSAAPDPPPTASAAGDPGSAPDELTLEDFPSYLSTVEKIRGVTF
jgi:hypothetical protein